MLIAPQKVALSALPELQPQLLRQHQNPNYQGLQPVLVAQTAQQVMHQIQPISTATLPPLPDLLHPANQSPNLKSFELSLLADLLLVRHPLLAPELSVVQSLKLRMPLRPSTEIGRAHV